MLSHLFPVMIMDENGTDIYSTVRSTEQI